MTELTGRRIVLTGASSGLGAHVARHLVGCGANVLAAARRADRLEALAAQVAGGPGHLVALATDVTVDADVRAMVDAAVVAFGGSMSSSTTPVARSRGSLRSYRMRPSNRCWPRTSAASSGARAPRCLSCAAHAAW